MLENKDKKYSIIKDIAIIVIGVVLIWFAVKVVFNVDNPFYVVSSGSMIPVLNVGDILIVKDGNTFNSLKVGDISYSRKRLHWFSSIYRSQGWISFEVSQSTCELYNHSRNNRNSNLYEYEKEE